MSVLNDSEWTAGDAMHPPCDVCLTPIQWYNAPTGGWWAHLVHPPDDHDAVTTIDPHAVLAKFCPTCADGTGRFDVARVMVVPIDVANWIAGLSNAVEVIRRLNADEGDLTDAETRRALEGFAEARKATRIGRAAQKMEHATTDSAPFSSQEWVDGYNARLDALLAVAEADGD